MCSTRMCSDTWLKACACEIRYPGMPVLSGCNHASTRALDAARTQLLVFAAHLVRFSIASQFPSHPLVPSSGSNVTRCVG